MSIKQATLCIQIALLTLVSLPALAAPSVSLPKATPGALMENHPTAVTFVVRVDDPTLIANSISLHQLDDNDRVVANLGNMRDDGSGADATAGDKISTLQVMVTGAANGHVRIRASAAFRGLLKRVLSPVARLDVQQSLTFTGVAAVGSPLAGTVTVKDAAGVVRSTPLGSNGAYAIDVSGMTAPFVFRAEGSANGHTYTVHSAATAADVGGTINITQLTDLVVDNIAGQVASAYFDNGNFSSLTADALNAEVALLKARLLPVLTALGVDASIDLLRSRFTPLASALDTALDILRVTLNTATDIAIIANIVTQQSILDDITVPAASETSPPVLSDTSGVASAATDIDAIKAALASFTAKFATGLPSLASVEAAMSPAYLINDRDRATQAAEFVSDSSFIGASFSDIDVKNIDYTDPAQVTATVDFTFKDRNGIEEDRVTDFRMLKGNDGIWRLHGNQRVIEAEVGVVEFRLLPAGCVRTGLSFSIEDQNSANNGGIINHVMVFGPGLPDTGLRYEPPPIGGGAWGNTAQGHSGYVMAQSCVSGPQPVSEAAIAAIPDGAGYLFVAYTSTDNSAVLDFPSGAVASGPAAGKYWARIQRRPLTLAEAVAADTVFPIITSPTNAGLAAYSNGPMTITATNLNANFYVYVNLQQDTIGGNYRDAAAWLPPTSSGDISTTLSLTAPAAGDTITFRNVHVETKDAYRRSFKTGYY